MKCTIGAQVGQLCFVILAFKLLAFQGEGQQSSGRFFLAERVLLVAQNHVCLT